MKKLITVKEVEALVPGPKVYHKKASPLDGFWLRVAVSGRRSWLLTYVAHSGAHRTLTLGSYPVLSPAEAQKLAMAALARRNQGGDPQAEKDERKRQLRQDRADSFRAVLNAYIEAVKKKGLRTWRTKQRTIEKHVLPAWGDRPIRGILRRDVQALIDDLDRRYGYDKFDPTLNCDVRVSNVARDVHGKLGSLFDWADRKDLLDQLPTRNIELHGVIARRDRVLSDAELAVILEAIERLPYPTGPYLRLLALTAQRRTEIAGLSRGEVSIPERTLKFPPHRMKAGRSHSLPIADEAMKVILKLPVQQPYLFSTDGGKTALGGFNWVKRKLDAEVAAIVKERGIEPVHPFRLHDFRRTARSRMADVSVPRDAAELILAHRLGDEVSQVYDRSEHRVQKLAGLTAWEGYLRKIAKPQEKKEIA